jgi:hypothetical protein
MTDLAKKRLRKLLQLERALQKPERQLSNELASLRLRLERLAEEIMDIEDDDWNPADWPSYTTKAVDNRAAI